MRIDSHHATALDTLRLNRSQQHDLQQQLLRRRRQQASSDSRREPRFDYDASQGLIVEVFHPGGTHSNYLVKPRNLSTHGIGFLHGSFLHHGTECNVWIRSSAGELRRIEGTVARCQWICGRVHEIGVLFEEAIELKNYLTPKTEPTDDAPLSIPLQAIEGRLLYLCDDEQAYTLIAPVNGVGLETKVVAMIDQALEQQAEQASDMALIDLSGGLVASTLAITALRESGFNGPIFALLDDADDAMTNTLRSAGATVVLTRPLTCESFINAFETPEAQMAPPVQESAEGDDQPPAAVVLPPINTAHLYGVMQAILRRMRDHVKKMWDRFTRLLS
jgi:CheY-like chemotaxis protein